MEHIMFYIHNSILCCHKIYPSLEFAVNALASFYRPSFSRMYWNPCENICYLLVKVANNATFHKCHCLIESVSSSTITILQVLGPFSVCFFKGLPSAYTFLLPDFQISSLRLPYTSFPPPLSLLYTQTFLKMS